MTLSMLFANVLRDSDMNEKGRTTVLAMRDLDIRLALRSQLAEAHAQDDTLILDELGLCQGAVRADLAVINGSLAGFEIKSDRDTLQRLPQQAAIYGQVFDYITIVVGSKHARGLTKLIPPFWGITVVSGSRGNVSLKQRRRPRRNKAVDPLSVARLLWRDEAIALLTEFGLDRGLRTKPRRELWSALADAVPFDELSFRVREQLRSREDWRADRPLPRGGD